MNTPLSKTALPADQLADFAAQLDEQRRFRLEQLRQSRTDVGARVASRCRTAADLEVDAILRDGAQLALAEIEAAQRRLIEGRFGRCVDCGSAVPIERLEVLPSVSRCLPCHRASTSIPGRAADN